MKLVSFFGNRGLKIVKGEDQYVWDENGVKYLDLHTGHGVAFLGHRNKIVVEYLNRQMNEIMTLTTAFSSSIRDEMLSELEYVKPDGLDNVFLLNSGSEAVELAVKIAKKITKRKKFVAFKNSFHGRTFAALSLTWNKKYREPFEPLMDDVIFAEFNNIESLKVVDDTIAGIIVEPVQGEGGVIPAQLDFMKALRDIADNTGSILIVDEVQSGFGRTGKIWAYQHFNIKPDIMTAGKAIGGGFPVSAVFMPDWIASKLDEGDHGSTYGGNPLAMAAVTASVKVLKNDNVINNVSEKGKNFIDLLKVNLKDFDIVRNIRGLGFMIGIDMRINPSSIIKALQEERILSLKAGVTTIRFLPPYMITYDDMRNTVDTLRKIFQKIEMKAA
ncbi:MAG: aspartate aminotransferase family protein [Thermoprotei archaeon]